MSVVADIFKVILIDDSDNVIGTTTLTDASIDVSVTENDVRGGRANELLGILRSDRNISISLTDTEFRYDWLAMKLGQTITTGAGVAYAMPKWYTAVDNTGSIEVTLDETPVSGTVKAFDTDGVELTVDSSANPITISSGAADGDLVEIRTYQYATDAATETIEINNTVFPTGMKCVLQTIEVDEDNDKATHYLNYEFTKALPTGNFTITTASERTAQAQSCELRVIKPKTSDVVGYVRRIPVSA